MLFDDALVARLKAAAAITALCPLDNIAWGERARGVTTAVQLTRVSRGQEWEVDRADPLETPRIQFDCWGPDKTTAGDLADAVVAEMQRTVSVMVDGVVFPSPATIEGEFGPEREDVTGTEGVFRVMLDLRIFHQPA